MISHRHLNHAAYLAYVPGVQPQLGGCGGRVHPVTSEYGGLEPKRILGGDQLPHFPVQRIMQFGTKTAHVFINSSQVYNRRAMNEMILSYYFIPGVMYVAVITMTL